MGISGLLPLLKKASKNAHVRKFSGCTVAIDAYCWLHKGSFGCAEKLGKGEPTTAYITYCMKYIQVLLDNNIKPILILDGRNLPSKHHTEKKRREKREENRKLARKYLQEGKKKEAWECFTRCVDITPAMAREFIKTLRSAKIDYIVAPYEADAQLAYLAKNGIVDIIITEDSDLILFGCPKIFFKMNVNGDGVLFEQEKIPSCLGLTPSSFQFDRFRWMCILSGCDYLPSLPGIGLGRAKTVMLASNDGGIKEFLYSVPTVLSKLNLEVPDKYVDDFIQAENTFLYQLVFDTSTRSLVPLTPYPPSINLEELKYAGSYEEKELALNMALGNIDIHTLKIVDNFDPLKSCYTNTSIWSTSYNPTLTLKPIVASSTVAMQLIVPSDSKTSVSKKRSLKVANELEREKLLEDKELVNMYISNNSPLKSEEVSSNELDKDSASDSPEYPTNAKRRRVTQLDIKSDESSPSRNTRSRNCSLPFLKSPDAVSSKIIVKSKYFRKNESSLSKISSALSPKNDKTDSEKILSIDAATSQLNIYGIDSESENFSLESSSYESHSDEVLSGSLYSSHFNKVVELISDDEDREPSCSSVSSTSCVSNKSGSYKNKSIGLKNASSVTLRTPMTRATQCRRTGLSKSSVKRDSKQRSVLDMFNQQQKSSQSN